MSSIHSNFPVNLDCALVTDNGLSVYAILHYTLLLDFKSLLSVFILESHCEHSVYTDLTQTYHRPILLTLNVSSAMSC